MNNLAVVYNGLGRNPDAEVLFQEALAAVFYSVSGATHPDTQTCFTSLLQALTALGKARDARELQMAHRDKGGK